MKNNKEEKHLRVAQAILKVIHEDGVSHLNLSKVAKKSKISRAWIYQYMGKNRDDLIFIAAEACSAFFARSNIKAKPLTMGELKQQLHEGAEFSIRSSVQFPIFLSMYFKFKGSSNAIGKAINKHETIWIKSFTQNFKRVLQIPEKKAEILAQTILMMRLGICHQLNSEPLMEQKIIKAIERLGELQLLLIAAQ